MGHDALSVLVVDDYAPLRALCATLLHRAGYQPITAASADDALERLAAPPTVSAVITDLNMPGIVTGADFVSRIRVERPDLSLVIMTGSLSNVIEPGESEAVLIKPFENQELLDALERVLAVRR